MVSKHLSDFLLLLISHQNLDQCSSEQLLLGNSTGVVNSLDFCRHRLSPLAAFTSSAYFLHNGGGDSEFANFTLSALKAFLEARSHNVSGNKQ